MASSTAEARYPRQLVIMVSDPMWQRIVNDAEQHRLSKSEVARTYLEAGVERADEQAAGAVTA